MATVGLGALVLRPPFPVVRLLARVLPRVLLFVDTDRRAIALTLDDGPHPATTPRILDVLAAEGARATFFVLGERAQAHPELVQRIREAGHELGNHTFRDEPSWRLSPAALDRSLRETERELSSHGPVTLFRPGSGWTTRSVLTIAERNAYRCVLGSVYPHDTLIPWRRYAAWDITTRVRPGAIVILHEGRPERARVVAVLGAILPALRRRGYEVVPVSELSRSQR